MDGHEELITSLILTWHSWNCCSYDHSITVNDKNDRDNDNGDTDRTMNVYRLIDDLLYLIATRY